MKTNPPIAVALLRSSVEKNAQPVVILLTPFFERLMRIARTGAAPREKLSDIL